MSTRILILLFLLSIVVFCQDNIVNPSFESGETAWGNLSVGSYEYFAPVDGINYAVSEAGAEKSSQLTDILIEAGKTYSFMAWARSIYDDEYVDCLLNCPPRDLKPGVSATTTAEIGFFYESTAITTVSMDVNPKALKGAPETYTNDDGTNVWVDYEAGYRHAFSENHFYQPVESNPILDPWFIGSDNYQEGQAESGAKGPVLFNDKKWIYGSNSCNEFCCGSGEVCKATLYFQPKSGGAPDYIWGNEDDQTYVLWHSGDEDPWLADGQVFYDDDERRLWMILGGKYFLVCELDTSTGYIKGHSGPVHYDDHKEDFAQVAYWTGDEWTDDNEWMEGSAIYKHNDYWYCFGSYGSLSINYSIRMGRGTSPTGPFYDKDGITMNSWDVSESEYGNSFLLGDDSEQLCPGHPHIWEEDGIFYLGYDYILEKEATEEFDHMAIRRLYWVNDWPTIWTPVQVRFTADNYPDAIGKKLGVSFQNIGETGSLLGIDYTSLTVSTPTNLDQSELTNLPTDFVLYQNSPNPFNPITTIEYQLPAVSVVELSIYNQLGQKLVTLVNRKQQAGHYQLEWDAGSFASGIYICSLSTAGGFNHIIKIVLLK